MIENTEQQQIIDQVEHTQEASNAFPEILAHPPLENTTFVFSIPVMGEWENGNALRMLRAMFSQRTQQDQAFEIELITNIGEKLHVLLAQDEHTNHYKTDQEGNHLISNPSQDDKDHQKEVRGLLREMDELKLFLEKILLAQKLAKQLIQNPQDGNIRAEMEQLLENTSEPLQREVVELAISKCLSISLAVIDATRTAFYKTDYKYASLASLRTLGADVASVRFEDKKNTVVLGMYDADTLPENNNVIRDIQQLFDKHAGLQYVFAGMTNLPAGHTADFVGDGPRENVRRTWSYNSKSSHGSPQISFRLKAYEKLQEIAGWLKTGFYGDEDRDTSIRLIYHFGALQEGLLLEASANLGLFPPTAMTADRLDGSVDSVGRRYDFAENGTRYLTADMGNIFSFREELLQEIDKFSQEQRQNALDFLQKSRKEFEKKQKIQRRLNRMIIGTFVDMAREGAVSLDNEDLVIDKDRIISVLGGDALLHYLEANPDVAKSVLASPNDLDVIEYFLGRRDTLPEDLHSLSPFQTAIREYVGDALALESFENGSIVSVSQDNAGRFPKWIVEDLRDFDSKSSLMHAVIAETLALGYTHRVFFETRQFLRSEDEHVNQEWPKNPYEQNLDMHFGDQATRLDKIKAFTQPKKETSKKWYEKINIKAFPILKLLKWFRPS